MEPKRDMAEKHYRVVKVLRGIGSPVRYQICRQLLENGEMTVTELTEAIGTSQNQTSQHLSKCKDLNLVRYRHEGRYVYYQLKKPEVVEEVIHLTRELSRDEDTDEG
jgi:DNA-binding transcriptional ArsR family regulator